MLVFCGETKFYRAILGISYEFGSELKRKGILEPDAVMDDGRPIYSMSQEAIESLPGTSTPQREGDTCLYLAKPIRSPGPSPAS
jgi:hypothetical protein